MAKLSQFSLSILPHSLYRRHRRSTQILIAIPLISLGLAVFIGLDHAPNTGRWRLLFMTEEEDYAICEEGAKEMLASVSGLIYDENSEYVQWARTVCANLARVIDKDLRPGVNEPITVPSEFEVFVIDDRSTFNAYALGSSNKIFLYTPMLELIDHDDDILASVLSHEMAHIVQRHHIESQAVASILLMIEDIVRGATWYIIDALGPFINDFFKNIMDGLIEISTSTTYNRRLEKEADLIGLEWMARAGYNPEKAVVFWERMRELELLVENENMEGEKQSGQIVLREGKRTSQKIPGENNENEDERQISRSFAQTVDDWFGASHPSTEERIMYLSAQMEHALVTYHTALKQNGPPKRFFETIKLPEHNVSESTIAYLQSWIKNTFFSKKSSST
ncbi:uncharacterized protein VTP21DRAFT_3715 [Calcarisporiella thermophila]|uniref:uncharacterized protein n=1 Tax=Calcarisporiella thermophila TaxID=911321 RepID=UPI003743FD02